MLEVAITSIKCALRDDFPEFREFYENREWEPEAEVDEENGTSDEAEANSADTDEANISEANTGAKDTNEAAPVADTTEVTE